MADQAGRRAILSQVVITGGLCALGFFTGQGPLLALAGLAAGVRGNMALVCPNHHAAIHSFDAPFDYQDLCFGFGVRRQPLERNRHLE